jgi:predicted nucleotidyltransferase
MQPLTFAIIKTLAYADLFTQALTEHELRTFLIEKTLQTSVTLDTIQDPRIIQQGAIFALKGREALFNLKHDQVHTSQNKTKRAISWMPICKIIPWIELVAITGSVAAGSAKKMDDIDLLIITQPNRLWLSRFILTTLLTLLKQRRHPHDKPDNVSNKFCLNMWLTTEQLEISTPDLYYASELLHMKSILNRHHTYERYLSKNSWLITYFPNAKIPTYPQEPDIQNSRKSSIDKLDTYLGRLQRRFMRPRSKEIVQPGLLKFHPHDYHAEILARYQNHPIFKKIHTESQTLKFKQKTSTSTKVI